MASGTFFKCHGQWHVCMASGMFFQYDASSHAVVNLIVLLATLVLPLAIVPLFQLQKPSATTVLPSCACNSAHLRPDRYSKWGLQEPQFWDCYQLAGSKMLLDRDSAVQKSEAAKFYHQSCECNPVLRCVWEGLLFRLLIWHFMARHEVFALSILTQGSY